MCMLSVKSCHMYVRICERLAVLSITAAPHFLSSKFLLLCMKLEYFSESFQVKTLDFQEYCQFALAQSVKSAETQTIWRVHVYLILEIQGRKNQTIRISM